MCYNVTLIRKFLNAPLTKERMFIVLFFSRKDKLYFEDGTQQQWCSTCTSSSDDSDYDRWDLDSEAPESINDRLARSRPLYKSQKSTSKTSKKGLHTNANGELSYSCSKSKMRNFHPSSATSPTLLFYDQHPDFNRPNWLLDHPQPYANSAPVKKHKKKRKKCAVQ